MQVHFIGQKTFCTTILSGLIIYIGRINAFNVSLKHQQVYLSYNNVFALKTLAARNNWVLSSKKNNVSMLSFSDLVSEC